MAVNKIKYLLVMVMVFTFHLSPFALNAQVRQLPLSDSARAYVVTCGAGNDFYTTFGHSAIRIVDPARGVDWVYNYGTFDFDTPHFYWRFAQGKLDYCLSRSAFLNFMATYDYEQRAVWLQQLDFTPQEVNNLYLMLEWNYQPENRYYRYDLFRDNCATRVRDMVESANGKRKIEFDDWEERSYRGWTHYATAGGRLEWWTLGVDLLLGVRADRTCNIAEAMFYPEEMMWLYNNAARDGNMLVAPTEELLSDCRPPLKRSFPPVVVFALLFAVAVLLPRVTRRSPLVAKSMDRLLFVVAGLIGLFLIFMWVGTDHWCTKWNLNILWASPLLLLIAIRMERSPRWALWLQLAMFAAALVYVIVCSLSPALVPIILTLIVRVAMLLKVKGRNVEKTKKIK